MAEILYSGSFEKLYWDLNCSNCSAELSLDFNNPNILRYGYVCPFCRNITNPTDMWADIVNIHKTNGEN